MSKKKLIEVEVLNKVYKAIEMHLEILEKYPITLENAEQVKLVSRSIDYLQESLGLLRSPDEGLKEMKREAFSKYKAEKEKLVEMKKGGHNIEDLEKQNRVIDSYLRLYLAYKQS